MFARQKIIESTTDLSCAVVKRDSKLVKELLDKGADVNAVDEMGCTAIRYAVLFCNAESVEILLKAGANVKYQVQPGAPDMTTIAQVPNYHQHMMDVGLKQSILYVSVNLFAFELCLTSETYIKILQLLLEHGATEGCDEETLQGLMIDIIFTSGVDEIRAFDKYVKVKLSIMDRRIAHFLNFLLMSHMNNNVLEYLVENEIFDRKELIKYLMNTKLLWPDLNKTARKYLEEGISRK